MDNEKRIINKRIGLVADMDGQYVLLIGKDDRTSLVISPEIAIQIAADLERFGRLALSAKEAAARAEKDKSLSGDEAGYFGITPRSPIKSVGSYLN